MVTFGPESDISASVGRGGANRPADVGRVKALLNNISTEDGGTDGTLDESDTRASGVDFEALVKAIIIFQKKNFTGWFPPDGLVERQRNTHKALVRMGRRAYLPIEPDGVKFIPPAGLVRDTDQFGYSRAGLRQDQTQEKHWSGRETNDPTPIQMVPLGGTRRLVVRGTIPGAMFGFELGGTNPAAAVLGTTFGGSVDITGRIQGEAELRAISDTGNVVATAILRVRERKTIRINTVHIGRPKTAGAENNFLNLVPSISRLYEQQTNIVFSQGSAKIMARINGIDVDNSKKLIDISHTGFTVPVGKLLFPDAGQLFSLHDTFAEFPKTGRDTVTVFFSDKIEKKDNQRVLGSTIEIGGDRAWFRIGGASTSDVSAFMVPAHEIGHALGLRHITAPGNDTYLMKPEVAFNNMRIPSDTLVDLDHRPIAP